MNEPAWKTKFCPILTLPEVLASAQATIAERAAASEQRRILMGGGQPALQKKTTPEAQACQGPACMWFIPSSGPDGKMTGDGHCAFALNALIGDRQLTVLGAIAHKLIGNDGMATQPQPSTPA